MVSRVCKHIWKSFSYDASIFCNLLPRCDVLGSIPVAPIFGSMPTIFVKEAVGKGVLFRLFFQLD